MAGKIGDVPSGQYTIQEMEYRFKDVMYLLKNIGRDMYMETSESSKLLTWINKIESEGLNTKNSLQSILDKINTSFGPSFSSTQTSTIEGKFIDLITSINAKITESGEGTTFSETNVDLLDLLNWMSENSGGSGSGSGFTTDELDLIENYKTKITSNQLCNPVINDILDSGTTVFIKLLGMIYDDLINHMNQYNTDITLINNKTNTLENSINTNIDDISNNAEYINTNITNINNIQTKSNNNELEINSNILPRLNTAETKINELDSDISSITSLNENTLNALDEIQKIEDTLIYSLNELRNFGESYNIITFDSDTDIYPTVKWNLYIGKDKFMLDQYVYGYEGMSIPNKLPYTLSHINSYLYYMDILQYSTLLTEIKNAFINNAISIIKNLLQIYFPAYFYTTHFYYNDNISDDSYGMIINTNTDKLLTITELLNFVNSNTSTGITLRSQLDDTISVFTDRSELFILDDTGNRILNSAMTLNSNESIKIKDMFIKDNDTTTNRNLIFLKHPNKIEFKYKLYVVTTVDTEIENDKFEYIESTGSTSSYHELNLNNFTFDPLKTYKFEVLVYYNKMMLLTQIINVNSSASPGGTAPTLSFISGISAGISLTSSSNYNIAILTGSTTSINCVITKNPGSLSETEVFNGTPIITASNEIEVFLDSTWGNGTYSIELNASNSYGSDTKQITTSITFNSSPSTDVQLNSISTVDFSSMSTTDLIIGTLLGTYTTMTQKITKDPGGTNTLIYDGPITPTATGDIEITMQPSWGDGNYEIEITATDSSTGITDTEVLNINVIFGTSTVTTGISGTPTTSNTSPLLVDFSATTNDSLSIGMLDGIGIINYEIHDDSKSPTLQDSGIVYETPDGEIEIPFDSTLGNGVYRLEIDVQDTSGTSIATETIYVNITF